MNGVRKGFEEWEGVRAEREQIVLLNQRVPDL